MKRPCGRLPQKKKAVPSSTLSRWVAVFASLFVLVGLSGCANRAPTSVDKEDGGKTQPKTEFLSLGYRDQYEIAAQNSALELLIDPSTMAIAVYAKDSGQLWTSNPSPDSYPEVVDEITINKLNSQVVLQYYNGQRAEELISYSDSVTKEQAEIYAIPNGLRVEYTIGGRESVDLYPQALTAQYVDEVLLPNLDDVQRERFLLYFDKYVYADTVDSLREELSATYKNFSQTDM